MTSDSHEARSAIFARNVRRLRDDRGWSQAELGRQLGSGHTLRQARVAAIEATGSVTVDQAEAFARAFGVPVETLLYETPPPTKAVRVQQLLRILKAVDRARDEAGGIVDEIIAAEPGPLGPPGTIVFADRIEQLPPSEE